MPGANQAAAAIGEAEADRLLKPLLKHDHLALAVSGGSDSTALMVVAAGWVKRYAEAPRLTVLTVDHGLRAEAADEAQRVAGWTQRLGLEHHCLRWQADKPVSGVQATARQARYGLMSDWCLEHGATGIVTAHTANDQAETLVMRLARGSGVDGLAGMMPETLTPWPMLRPLLGVTRERLQATLTAQRHDWIDDPSNEDVAFERIRVRKGMAKLSGLGLDVESLALSARRLGRARQALDAAASDLMASVLTCHPEGYGEVELEELLGAPEEVQLRVLQKLVWQFGSHDMPKLAALERAANWLVDGNDRARCISGCRIVRRKHRLVFGREPGRIAAAPLALTLAGSKADALWDRRFRVVVHGARAADRLSVVPFAALDGERSSKSVDMPAFVRDSLPAVLNRGALHCVPHLGMVGADVNPSLAIDVKFIAE